MRQLICVLFSLLLVGCVPFMERQRIIIDSKKIEDFNALPKTTENFPTVTIWIHGTCLLSDKLFNKLCLTPKGFVPVSEIKDKFQVHKAAKFLSKQDPQRFNFEHFYAFGWSGKLSFAERKKAAQDLYSHIRELTKNYKKKYRRKPKIRLITHSHGGNVALNLAHICNPRDRIKLEELILLGCPIQHETVHKAKHPFFKKIYSFFSTLDTLQIIDPQGLQNWNTTELPKNIHYKRCLLSGRCFPLDPKIKQIQMKMNGRGILHVEFLLTRFLSLLPVLLHEIDKLHPNDVRIKLAHVKK